MPEYYELYLRLKRWNMPMLVAGGYYDQPWLDVVMIEACSRAEQAFRPVEIKRKPEDNSNEIETY